jgi:uncharacterized membrane protein
MNSSCAEGKVIRIASPGQAFFAAAMIWLGAMGLGKGTFVPVWEPVPEWVPAREALAYLCAFISLASGIGLLWQRTAAVAARVVFASLMVLAARTETAQPLLPESRPPGCLDVRFDGRDGGGRLGAVRLVRR